MVAYSFQRRFVPLIEAGLKRQTIRAHRKRHARPGERLQLYFGLRSKHCRKIIPDPICLAVENIEIDVSRSEVEGCRFRLDAWRGGAWQSVDDALARADGFGSAQEFWRFWLKHHGPGLFSGVLIRWEVG